MSGGVTVAPCPCGSGKRFDECHGMMLVTGGAASARRCPCGGGKLFEECHGMMIVTGMPTHPILSRSSQVLSDPGPLQTDPGRRDHVSNESLPPSDEQDVFGRTLTLGKAPVIRKLDLACGQRPREGFEGVDIWPGAQHVVNLQQYPWPFADESVLELHCSHYIEHIPMCEVLTGAPSDPTAFKDSLFAFFDECWRILVPDGWLHVIVPCHRSDRAFQDPTHRRFITANTFAYMSEEWRRGNCLDHYNVECNFAGSCNPVVDASMNLRHPEAAQMIMRERWNTILDWTADLQKKPRLPPKGG